LYAACGTADGFVAKRVPLNRVLNTEVMSLFDQQEESFRRGVTSEVPFDGAWHPEPEEFLVLDLPGEAEIFTTAVSLSPASLPLVDTCRLADENIKALFVPAGCGSPAGTVLIQNFSAGQLLSRKFALLEAGNAFRRLDNEAFTLDTGITAIIEHGLIKFKSFHKLRTIISLSQAYREATNQEVQAFVNHGLLHVDEPDQIFDLADQTVRKLIHGIRASGALDTYSARQIQRAAGNTGAAVALENDRLKLPAEKNELKLFLRFLDEGMYLGPLSQQRFITNSKRRV
jgi:hypothetical protein